MNQTLDLKSMGFEEMQNEELMMMDGGGWNPIQFIAEWFGGKLLDKMVDDWKSRSGSSVTQTDKVGYMAYN